MKYLIAIILLITVGCGSKKEEPKEVRPETNIIRFLDTSGNVVTVTTEGGNSEVYINGERWMNGAKYDTGYAKSDDKYPTVVWDSVLRKSIFVDTVSGFLDTTKKQ